ncbi:MAG: hypothetical protein SNJ29_07685 [Rikenellaceae bacterium]
MKKHLNILLLLFVFCSCSQTDEIDEDPQSQPTTGELIDIQIGATEAITKVTYTPNSDNSIFSFAWEVGDEVSVIVPGTNNENQQFTATTAEASTLLDGKIATWDGEQTLYAIYPYSALGYTIDSSAQTLFYDNSSQTIDATAGNSFENSLMVVAVDDATAVSESEYNIPNLSFTQVMSLFNLDICDIPEGERCTTIGFEIGSSLFVASADIDLTDGKVTPRTYSSSVSAIIENQSGTEASLNLRYFQ